jgi:hypothetical protein
MTARVFTPQALKVRADKASEDQARRMFLMLCEQRGIPAPTPEYKFAAPDRAFRFDYAWPEKHVALEVEGGIWTRGAHMRGKHALSDMQKYNLAALRGWKVLRCVPKSLFASETVDMLRVALR